MGKRARKEDATEDVNPFAKAGKKKLEQSGGQPQHTVKYCVWEVLREQPAGLSVEDLLHEMQSRKLRSFANSTKPVSQVYICETSAAIPFLEFPESQVALACS